MNLTEIKSISQTKEIHCDDILCCILGLRGLEVEIFWILCEGEFTLKGISDRVNRDRSVVQRAVYNLISNGLVSRRGLRVRRGRKYVYSAVEPGRVKERLLGELDYIYGVIKTRVSEMVERKEH